MTTEDVARIRIALAQTCPSIAEPSEDLSAANVFRVLEENLLDVRDWVEEAVRRRADVVVFPEYFLQGPLNDGRQYLAYPSAHAVAYLSRLSRHHHVSVVGSVIHPVSTSSYLPDLPESDPFAHLSITSSSYSAIPDPTIMASWNQFVAQHPTKNHIPKLENTAIYVDEATGRILGDWVKSNLWHPEREYLTAGNKTGRVFETKWGRCGLLICWDVSHPSSSQALSDQAVDLVFAPTYWIGYDSAPTITAHHPHPPAYEKELLSALSYARAFETETVWVLCNAGGNVKEGYFGGSGIWMPLKGKVGGCEDSKVQMQVVEVNLSVLKDARELYKIRQDKQSRVTG